MGISCSVSEISGDFSRKSSIFVPRVFNTPLNGFHFELGIGARGPKSIMMWLVGYQMVKKF